MTVIFSGNSNLFKSKVKIIGKTPAGNNKKDVKKKYYQNIWVTFREFLKFFSLIVTLISF